LAELLGLDWEVVLGGALEEDEDDDE